MSKVKELADEEAARAEAETPEPTPEPEPEPEGDEPEAPHPDDGDEGEPVEPTLSGEQQGEAFAHELRRHEAEWARVAGVPKETLTVCASCGGVGFLEQPIASAEHVERCDRCHGYGQVQSGSLRADRALVDCDRCSGYGYVPKVAVQPALASVANGPADVAIEMPSSEPPEVVALRAAGYTVVPPIHVTTS
jgi:hypothetical protein